MISADIDTQTRKRNLPKGCECVSGIYLITLCVLLSPVAVGQVT